MNTWSERLRARMNELGLNASELCRVTGVTPPAMKKWIEGQTASLRYGDAITLANALKVSPDWLMLGTGGKDLTIPDDAVSIDLVDVRGSCGFGYTNFEDTPQVEKLVVTRDWFIKNFSFYNPRNIRIITADGDSMSPEIDDGDSVFIDISDKLVRDGIYVVLVDGDLFIKRVQRMPKKHICLISENPAYKEIDINLDSDIRVDIVGRVIKSMKLRSH